MMTIEEFYRHFVKQLKTIYDERESVNITDWIFESIAHIKRLDRITNKQQAISSSAIQQMDNALQQLLIHKPVQYVLGEAWFYKMKLFVNEHVLIPRPETEELVEWVVNDVRCTMHEVRSKTTVNVVHQTSDIVHVLDIGTGSGCIAIALKKELTSAGVLAIDVSEKTLQVARKNAKHQNVEIEFKQVDFLDERSWPSLQSFNIIISNPPYIPAKEKNKLAKNVVDHEPYIALFVNDTDPCIFYRKMAAFAGKHLNEKGKVFVEVHEDHAKEVQHIFDDKNFTTEIKRDMHGRERMIKANKAYIP